MTFFSTIAAASFRRYGAGEVVPPFEYQVSILSPTEGQEVTADFSVLATDNKNTVETNLAEGQEVQSDFTVTAS